MPDALNPRSRRVLRAAVAQYIETGRPVGSKALVEAARLEHSPATTRAVLRDRAVVVFLDQSIDALRHRLHGSSRPSLTGAPLVDELEEVFARREPLYRGLADRTVTVGNSLEETLRAVTAPPV